MGALYVCREGALATANVWGNLATLGSLGTVNAVTVPEGYMSIKKMYVAFSRSTLADSAGGVCVVRLKGSGVKYGPADFLVGGMGAEITGNSAKTEYMIPLELNTNVAIQPGGEVWVQASQNGTDWGTAEVLVGLVLTRESAPERYYMTRHIQNTSAVDTDLAAGTLVDDTAAGAFQIPGNCRKIYSMIVGAGPLSLATATGGTYHIRLRGSGLAMGEQCITAGGMGALSTTTGVSGGYMVAEQIPTDLEIRGGGQINLLVAQTGVDSGSPSIGATLEVGP